ncbi:MAG: lamin tail domain-containing protein [Parcubacteria group bacterium]|nr:lamin tail domain-containing protein [Parcubacteria group bacterium]
MSKNLIAITGGLILVSGFLFYQNGAAYSDTTTHPDLTREVITFYELSTGKKFTEEQKQWVIQGSIDEDRAPRWLNHFYDQVYERGLSTEMVGINGYLAKNWAQYSSYQTINPGNIANLWAGNGPVISGSWWGDFSYEAAIKDYSKDKEKEAYVSLGHILHLIEDVTVPEHTRNDAHPGGDMASFYEDWTKENSSGLTQDLGKRIFNQGHKPVIYSDLESYFNNLATYTNTHFFSPRTINSKLYQKPKIVYEDGNFAYGLDENGQYFDLAVVNKKSSYRKTYEIKDSNNQVLQEYWLRLSRQAVINGAGVIQLFLTEAEKAKEVELAKQKVEAQQLVKKSSLISQIYNFFRSPDAPMSEPALTITSEPIPAKPQIVKLIPKTEFVAQTPVPAPKPIPAPVVVAPTPPPPAVSAPVPESAAPAPTPAPQTNNPVVYVGGGGGNGGGSSGSNTQQSTQQNSTQENIEISTFQVGDLVINEIMYNPEGADDKHEWIELYNNSGHSITLTGGSGGWKFDDGATSLHGLNEPPTNSSQGSMMISASGYVILADNAATFLTDYQGFNGAVIDTVMDLKNSTSTIKTIKIIAPDGAVIDSVLYSNSWGADGNSKTLERKSAPGGSNEVANWAQSSAPGGTPGALNNWELSMSDIDNSASTTVAFDDTATSTETILGLGTDVSSTTTIATDTTWTLAGSPYRLIFNSVNRPTVAAGAVLTIEPGVKVIPQGGGYTALEIQGTLNAVATSGAPIIFTSINDADNSTSTTPQKGDWLNIAFSQGSQANLDYVEFRYGGQGNTLPLYEMVNIVGATVNIKNSKFENSQNTALHLVDSLGVVENSTFLDNNCGISIDSSNGIANTNYAGCYGVHTTGQVLSAAPQIKNNQFIRNQIGVEVRSGAAPIMDNNIFTDNGYPIKIESSYPSVTNSQLANSTTSPNILNGIAISGYTHFSQNHTLKNDPQLPYILETNGPDISPYIDVDATLTLEPGVIFKTGHTFTALNVNGSLIASTTPDNPIVFTSLKDDARGGDTNGDGSTSSPQDSDWANVKFLAGSIGNFVNTIFSYGGSGFVPYDLPPINTLAKDFPAVTTSGNYTGITSSEWIAENSYNFNKVIFHNFSTNNPQNLGHLAGIKDSGNNFIASTELGGLQNIEEIELTAPLQGQFMAGERYYAIIQISQPDGTSVGQEDSFSIGIDESGMLAVAFYELVPGAPANPALSIDAGASVIVQ